MKQQPFVRKEELVLPRAVTLLLDSITACALLSLAVVVIRVVRHHL